MRITASAVSLGSAHSAQDSWSREEHLQVWRPNLPKADKVSLSPVAQTHRVNEPEEEDEVHDLKTLILKMLIEELTGEEINLFDPRDLQVDPDTQRGLDRLIAATASATSGRGAGAWGMHYSREDRHTVSESTVFVARGVIRTADQRQFEISVDLRLSRSFTEVHRVDVRAGAALKDPLVIDLSGRGAHLEGARFAFDLDMDGAPEALPTLAPGAGFLVDDRNGNGEADDGGELLGPSTGDGFAELARADADHNGWIDEADPIWNRLRIWEPGPEGQRRLVGLASKGVGALYLGRASTPFTLLGADREALGAVRDTGVWVGEDGRSGALQRLDLAV